MDVEELLIDCVREERILYDPSNRKYMDNNLKTKIWRNIAIKCGINSGDAAKVMWKKLRDCYRASRKRKTSGTAASFSYPWKYEMQMSFLQPFMRDRHRTTNTWEEQEDIGTQEISNSSPMQVSVATESQEHISSDEETLPTTAYRPERIHSQPPLAKRKKEDKSVLHFLQQEAKKIEKRSYRRDEIKTLFEQNDPLKLFFDSMYGTTKALPSHLQRKIKKKIFLIVSEAEEQAEELSTSSGVVSAESNSTPVHTNLDQPVASHSDSNNDKSAAKMETFCGVSPFSGSIDIDCEEKPNVNKEILYLEKDWN